MSDEKMWIGDTQRSDLEEYKRIKEAEERYEKMNQMANAGDLGDVAAVTADLTSEKKADPVMDYIDSKTPKQDSWQEYPEPVEQATPVEELEHGGDSQVDEPVEVAEPVEASLGESFVENEGDITEKAEPVEDGQTDFEENAGSMGVPVEQAADIKTEFGENAGSMDVPVEPADDIKNDFKDNAGDVTDDKW